MVGSAVHDCSDTVGESPSRGADLCTKDCRSCGIPPPAGAIGLSPMPMSLNTVVALGRELEEPPRVSGSAPYRVAHVNHTIAEPPMVKQLEIESNALGQPRLTTAHDHRVHEQHALVDQPVPKRLSPDSRTANAQVRAGRLL